MTIDWDDASEDGAAAITPELRSFPRSPHPHAGDHAALSPGTPDFKDSFAAPNGGCVSKMLAWNLTESQDIRTAIRERQEVKKT